MTWADAIDRKYTSIKPENYNAQVVHDLDITSQVGRVRFLTRVQNWDKQDNKLFSQSVMQAIDHVKKKPAAVTVEIVEEETQPSSIRSESPAPFIVPSPEPDSEDDIAFLSQISINNSESDATQPMEEEDSDFILHFSPSQRQATPSLSLQLSECDEDDEMTAIYYDNLNWFAS